MAAMRRTRLSLWLILISSLVLSVQPFEFGLNLVGFVLAAMGGFSLILLWRQISRNRFIVFELFFIAAIGASFVNMFAVE